MKSLYVIICVSLISISLQWGYYGHMLTAYIAMQELKKNNPQVWDIVSTLSNGLNLVTNDMSQDFMTASVWADDLKYEAFNFMDNWHYLNLVYNPTNFSSDNFKNASIFQPSSPFGIYHAKNVIMLNKENNQPQDVFAKSMMMRFLVHIVGDIHQPLHNIEYVDSSYPKSDFGGNEWNITMGNGTQDISQEKYKELHSFCDWGAYMWPKVERPISTQDYNDLGNLAQNYTNKYPRSSLPQLANSNPDDWGNESYNIAVQNFYEPLLNSSDPTEITPAYQNNSYEVITQQIALGGYRLADLTVQYLNSNIQNKTNNKTQNFLSF